MSNTSSSRSTAAAVANAFLDFYRSEPTVPPIDQMKLQKLLFYAHAWHLANYDQPLFEEDIEAWPWGPVIRDIYVQTKPFGRDTITAKMARLEPDETIGIRSKWVYPDVEDDELKQFLKFVWDAHKNYTGVQLSNATHEPGEPWTLVSENYNGDLSGKPTIPNSLIRSVYKSKIQ